MIEDGGFRDVSFISIDETGLAIDIMEIVISLAVRAEQGRKSGQSNLFLSYPYPFYQGS